MRQRPKLTQHRLQAMWFAKVQLGLAAEQDDDIANYSDVMRAYVNDLRDWWEEKHGRDLFSDKDDK